MSVHYKFKSALEYDTVTFDGLHISVRDLKKAILHQKRIGKNTDFDLQVTNAQTKEVYTDDGALIPKNTSLIVARIPLTAQQKKAWDRAESNQQLAGLSKGVDMPIEGQDPGAHRLAKAVDLSSLDASEDDKIQAMMTQSTQDYNPVNYMKIRGAGQMGEVPSSYRCFKCHQPGHWIKNCPLGLNQEPIEIKKSTGIPRSFMVPVEGPGVPGAMMTPTGQFAVPAIDHQAYKEGKKERPPFQQEPEPVVEKPEIPEDLLCNVCKDLLADAVMIPCCGNSFCDECIRTVLLESEDHECPDCKEKDVSPDTLIPNRFLRNNVNNFKNATGYNKSTVRQPVPVIGVPLLMQQIPLEPSGSLHEFTDAPAGDVHLVKVEVITSAGINVHPPRLRQPVPSTIPVLGSSSHLERGSVVRQPQPGPPSSGLALPGPVQHGGPPLLPPDAGHGAPPVHIQDPQRGHPLRPHGHPLPSHLQLVPQPPGVAGPSVTMHANGGPPGPPGVPLTHIIMPPAHEIAPHQPSQGQPPPPAAQQPQHMPGMHSVHPSGPRRSVEERPGTPTIDEHNQDIQSAPLPDTSVPPPNFPPGEEPSFTSSVGPAPPQTQQPVAQPIETLGARFQHRMPVPHSYRGEHPYGQIRNFTSRGSHFEHGHPSYHHEAGSLPGPRPPHYADLDRDGHPVRGSFRGYHRGRGRIMHGGYRGSHMHHQPPPPGLSRGGIHNGNQAGTIDDPLEAFERMLREKDERDHKLRRSKRSRSPRSYSPRSRSRSSSSRSYTRSRSRSRTRSRTRSRSRTPRSRTPRSRTPRKRSRTRTRTRSRSRSFTISRSRSRTFSRSPTPRPHSPRGGRDYSPRRRASPRYRTPPRSPPSRFQRSYKDVRPEFEPPPYYEPSEFQYTGRGGGRGRGGRFGQRKDYGTGGGGKDYYDESYSGSRFGLPLPGSRDMHHRTLEPLLPHPPGVTTQNFRRYEHFDMAPPGTGPDIPGIGSSFEKPRYERNTYENRPLPGDDFLTPPGVDHRYRDRDRDVPGSRERDIGPPGVRDRDICPSGIRDRDVGIRDRDMGMPSLRDRDRDIGPPGVRDRDLGIPLWDNRDRGSRDDMPPSRDGLIGRDRDMGLSDRSREKDRDRDRDVRERDGDRDRGRGDYYDADHRRSYDKSYGSYNSPDVKKRKQSLSPGPGRHERYSSSERHHRRGGDRRKNSGTVQVQQGGKENRHMSQQQPVETVVDAAGGQRERDKDTQKRERVLVEVRKEPSVDRLKKDDKGKKEEDKKSKDKKKKKKEKEPEGEKLKKKRRKEKKEGKKEGQEPQEKIKIVVKGAERKGHHKEKEGEEKAETEEDNKVEEKPAATSVPVQQEKKVVILTSGTIVEKVKGTTLRTFDAPPTESIVDGLYGDMEDTRIDDNVIASYGKVIAEEAQEKKVESDTADKGAEVGPELGDGVELRVKADTGSDSEGAVKSVTLDPAKANVMLAPLPELSKWELEEEFTPGSSFEKKEGEDGIGGGSQTDKTAGKIVTSEVLKRAENAIFQKAINAIRPIEPPKKISGDRKVYTSSEKRAPVEVVVAETVETRKVPEKDTREARKTVNSIQITIPTGGHVERSVEIASLESSSQPVTKGKGKLDRSKFSSQWGEGTDSTSPHRVPAKERLGARVDGDGDRKKEDNKESKRRRSRSESRERKHAAAKKGLKSAIEKKHTISRSHSRSPHHRKESKYAEEARRYDGAGDRRYLSGDSRSKRGDREGRYADVDRDRRPLDRGAGGDSRRREHSESKKWDESREKKEIIKSPERRTERSVSHEAKVEKTRSKLKEEREKSMERGKARHKAKKKTKYRSESRNRKKSVSDRESKRSKKKDKKHKKEKGKKHKQRDEKKEGENGKEDEEAEKSEALKEVKAGTSNDAAPGVNRDNGKIMEALETAGDQSKDKPRKGGRRNPRLANDRKKSTLDEASFEPDYDASSSVDTDVDDGGDNEKKLDGSGDKKSESNVSPGKKRDRSASIDPAVAEQKRQKLDKESDKSEKATTDDVTKKESGKAGATKGSSTRKRNRSLSSSDSADDDSSDEDDDDSSSGSSSSSDDDSSDDSSVHRRRKKKSHDRRHKRNKKSSRRASNSSSDTESESESASSSDSDGGRGRKGGGRGSKKHRHRSKLSKKKKKSSKHR
ncbi:E3 ubiquitin-protein ligase RBBP6 isoform X3 [Zootermopsis nevadensis]|uniref:E3 ubiquitin-protein ligase RBBP6 isoform X3 n=1 Tax=Zootermopsis nevadensis TaxID=136037 RepID=UPI000B8E2602|nr:E3 ubiquitin-protein ligase RBBP6 isoform X3 [Zootermopsis nevadensis]